ncbi:MAG: M20/M25/M40 family metallo-hydrolase [Tissierellia bacterium]|nr:M20/M25/M40 family metallo-hydrolase [Tissierellia bacterium]
MEDIYSDKIIEEIKKVNSKNFTSFLEDLRKIVGINSVRGKYSKQFPFGKNINTCLETSLDICDKLGFKTHYNKYYGYAEFGQKNDKYIGVFGHLDTVEIGKGWNHNPLGFDIENNRIYARGILDNKGPILSVVYALYALKVMNIIPQIPIRIVFGINEETGFEDMRVYNKNEKAPYMGFTPDCKFPVVYAERGRLNYEITFNNENEAFEWINHYIFPDSLYAKRLKIDCYDEEFGRLEIRNHKLISKDKKIKFTSSVSYPKIIQSSEIIRSIKNTLVNADLKIINDYKAVYFDKKSLMIKKLQKAYNKIADKKLEPVTTSGGTYAKIIKNIVPFGPSFPGQKDIAHNPDEWMDICDLKKILNIYTLALLYLQEE